MDEFVIASRGPGVEIVELARRAIAARSAVRRAEPCDERSLDDAVVVEPLRERAQPRR